MQNSDGSNTIVSNIIFRSSNELKNLHLLVIELKHPILGFDLSNIELEPNNTFTRFIKLLNE